MLFVLSATILNDQSKLCKNHIIIVPINITVKALLIKSLAFSHMCIKTLLAEGTRYAGNSITNGTGLPLNTVLFNINPDNIWTVYPQGYEAVKYTTENMKYWDDMVSYFSPFPEKKKVKFIQEEFDV